MAWVDVNDGQLPGWGVVNDRTDVNSLLTQSGAYLVTESGYRLRTETTIAPWGAVGTAQSPNWTPVAS